MLSPLLSAPASVGLSAAILISGSPDGAVAVGLPLPGARGVSAATAPTQIGSSSLIGRLQHACLCLGVSGARAACLARRGFASAARRRMPPAARRAGGEFVFRIGIECALPLLSFLSRRLGLRIRNHLHQHELRRHGGSARPREISESRLSLRLTAGNCSGAIGSPSSCAADRRRDVGRIEIRQGIDRRMRNGGADRPRHAEHGRMNSAEGRRDEIRAGAGGDAGLARKQRAEVAVAEAGRDERQRPARRNRSPPISAVAVLYATEKDTLNATPLTDTARQSRQYRKYFYDLINLATALTADAANVPG